MTTTGSLRASAAAEQGNPSGLHPAETLQTPHAAVGAGPFGVPDQESGHAAPASASALLTALLIVYPAFVTVAVIALGLLLSRQAGV